MGIRLSNKFSGRTLQYKEYLTSVKIPIKFQTTLVQSQRNTKLIYFILVSDL